MAKKSTEYFSILMCVYCVFVVVQNIFEMKTVGTSTWAIMGGGTIVSWVSFLVMDIMSEVYGKEKSVKCFTLAGILNLVVFVLARILILMPGTYVEQNEAFAQIFSNGLRTTLASFVAFWIGNYINVGIMVKMKNKSKDEKSNILFFIRAVVSTIFGQLADNFIFLVIAFAPIGLSVFEMPWADILSVTATGTMLETLIESVFVPIITTPAVRHIQKSL